jgi:hypothetical protein
MDIFAGTEHILYCGATFAGEHAAVLTLTYKIRLYINETLTVDLLLVRDQSHAAIKMSVR